MAAEGSREFVIAQFAYRQADAGLTIGNSRSSQSGAFPLPHSVPLAQALPRKPAP